MTINENEGALGKRFQGISESIGIAHAGKNMPCPSSAMSSGRVFLDGSLASVARLRFTGNIKLKRLPGERE